jgi:hypothetical protein
VEVAEEAAVVEAAVAVAEVEEAHQHRPRLQRHSNRSQ